MGQGIGHGAPPAPFELLFDRNPNPMWVFDRGSLAITAVNEAALATYGYSRAEFLALTIRDLRPSEDMAVLDGHLAEKRNEDTVKLEVRHRAKDGSTLEVELSVLRFVQPDGREAALVCAVDVTWRRSAEAAARASELWFRTVIDRCSDGIGILGPTHDMQYMSLAVSRMLGFTPDELVANKADRFPHPDDFSAHVEAYRAVARSLEPQRMLARFRHKDGQWRWLETVVTNLLADPIIRGMLVNVRDVTDRVQAEEALKEAKARLSYLLSATSAVTYTLSRTGDGAVTFMSDNVSALLGYQAREFIDKPTLWSGGLHPDDRQRVLTGNPGIMELGRAVREYRFLHKDGRYRWMRDEQVVALDDKGGFKEIVGCWIDVTTRKEADAALRVSEATFRALIEHLPTAVFVHRDLRIIYANPAMVHLLGYERAEELHGRSPYDITPPELHERLRDRLALHASRGTFGPAEAQLRRRDGPDVVVELEALKLDYEGAPATLVLARDLTERREMLARMALADRMVSIATLAAGVAHEINNPLAYVITNLSLLASRLPAMLREPQRAPVDYEEVEELLQDSLEGAARVRSVVHDLRMLSRSDDQTTGPTDVRASLESSIKMAWNDIRHRARLVKDLHDVPRVEANPSRLAQVFINLLVNAAQAIPDGNAEVNEIHVSCRAPSADRVVVEVRDTGRGISPEARSRIFEPFFTTKPTGEGTGLGLAICHGIVSKLGGEITVDSEAGKGSTFRVLLPVVPALAQETQQGAAAASSRRGRVLIVDDEPGIGKSLRLFLSDEHDVVVVTRARDALTKLEAGAAFDVVLCDMMMPDMNGMDLYAELERRAPELAARVVFLTGGAFTDEARAFLAARASMTLEKPFEPDDLRALLRRLVDARPAE